MRTYKLNVGRLQYHSDTITSEKTPLRRDFFRRRDHHPPRCTPSSRGVSAVLVVCRARSSSQHSAHSTPAQIVLASTFMIQLYYRWYRRSCSHRCPAPEPHCCHLTVPGGGSGRGVPRPASLSRLLTCSSPESGTSNGRTEQSIRSSPCDVIALMIAPLPLLALSVLLAGHGPDSRSEGSEGGAVRRHGRHEPTGCLGKGGQADDHRKPLRPAHRPEPPRLGGADALAARAHGARAVAGSLGRLRALVGWVAWHQGCASDGAHW